MDAFRYPNDADGRVFRLADLCASRPDRRVLPILPDLGRNDGHAFPSFCRIDLPQASRLKCAAESECPASAKPIAEDSVRCVDANLAFAVQIGKLRVINFQTAEYQ